MRDKKMFISVLLITTVVLFIGGCGNQAEPVNAEPAETVKEIDAEESTVESLAPTPSPTVEPEESMESSESTDNSENEVNTIEEESGQDLEYEIISIDDTVMYATADCNIRSGAGSQYDKVGSLSYAQEVTINGKVEADEDKLWYVIKTEDGSTQMVSASMLSETKPVAQASSGSGSGSSSNSGGGTGDTGNSETASTSSQAETAKTESAEPAPAQTKKPAQTSEPSAPAQPEVPANTPASTPAATPTPEPVHEHSWKEHVVTNQVWVPNVVVVDDYEEHTVESYMFYCACGYETADRDVISNHVKEAMRANDGQAHNFTIHNNSYTEQVKVGSHEEDQGHYETSTYVDYYYCDCGATK